MFRPLLSSLLALSLLTFVACGSDDTESTCGPSNCNGCCESGTDRCLLGSASAACGRGGGECQVCTSGTSCNTSTGQCQAQLCSASTCPNGCCDAAGKCVTPGNTAAACGKGGQLCQACSSGSECLSGTCQTTICNATNCAGCCAGTTCQPSPNTNQCGILGSQCQACTGGNTCNLQTGQCQDPTGCGITCQQSDGCCLNNQCQPGTHPAACGRGGMACDVCESGEECVNKTCVPAQTYCTPTNCPTGCCDTSGRCHYDGAINEQYCGALGLSCDTCQTWEECSLGSCKPKQTSCDCGVGQCCKDGACVSGNGDFQCGTMGAPCANCILQLPPTTCNTSTYTCGGSTSNCTGCSSQQCCLNNQCVTGTFQTQCGSDGDACQNCGTGSCTWQTDGYKCTGVVTGKKLCIPQITLACNSMPAPHYCEVDDDHDYAKVYLKVTVGGKDGGQTSSIDLPSGFDQLNTVNLGDWCTTARFEISDFLQVQIEVVDDDGLWGDDTIEVCNESFTAAQVAAGSAALSGCAYTTGTAQFQ